MNYSRQKWRVEGRKAEVKAEVGWWNVLGDRARASDVGGRLEEGKI